MVLQRAKHRMVCFWVCHQSYGFSTDQKLYGFWSGQGSCGFERFYNRMVFNGTQIVWLWTGQTLHGFWPGQESNGFELAKNRVMHRRLKNLMVLNGQQKLYGFSTGHKSYGSWTGLKRYCLEKATNRQAFQCPPSYGFERAKHRMVCQRVTQVMIFERINHRMVLTGHEFVWCLNGPKNVLFSMVHKSNVFVEQAQNRMAFERVNQHPTVLKGRKFIWLCNGPKIQCSPKVQQSCGFQRLKKHMFFSTGQPVVWFWNG